MIRHTLHEYPAEESCATLVLQLYVQALTGFIGDGHSSRGRRNHRSSAFYRRHGQIAALGNAPISKRFPDDSHCFPRVSGENPGHVFREIPRENAQFLPAGVQKTCDPVEKPSRRENFPRLDPTYVCLIDLEESRELLEADLPQIPEGPDPLAELSRRFHVTINSYQG